MFIAIDFDGTCVTNDFPKIGKDIGAVPVLKELVRNKHKIILLTNRSGKELTEAINWFAQNSLPLFGINKNPIQWKFSKSPKIYADLYIEDRALGCPLKTDSSLSNKPFVDWSSVAHLLMEKYNISINPE